MTLLIDLLEVPRFSDLTFFTDGKHKEIDIKNIEISETPDIALYMPENSVLLTTAMYYQHNQSELRQLIDTLITINCAGLGIKLGRFLDDVDQEIIDYANQRHFPIFSIPKTKPLGGLLHKLTNYIRHIQTEELTYALDIQKQFSNLLINDATIVKIILEFSKIVEVPIIMVNPFKHVIAQSQDFFTNHLPTQFITSQLIDLNSFSDRNQSTVKIIEDRNKNKLQAAVYPIKSNLFYPYFLIILKPEQIPYPVSEFAIEQALLVLSYVLLKNEKIEESKKQIKSDYFTNFIGKQSNHPNNTDELYLFGKNFGIQYAPEYRIIFASIKGDSKNRKQYDEQMELAYQWLNLKIEDLFSHSIIFIEKNTNRPVIILQGNYSNEFIKEKLMILINELKQTLPIDLRFYCGQECQKIDDLSSSFIEAKIAYDNFMSSSTDEFVTFYQQKGLLNLLETMGNDEISYFCQNILKELAYPTDTNLMELRKTLKIFLDNQCEVTKTANDLFVHRNTVKYRIDNIQDILKTTINTPENSLNLRLALYLSEKNRK